MAPAPCHTKQRVTSRGRAGTYGFTDRRAEPLHYDHHVFEI